MLSDFEKEASVLLVMWNARLITGDDLANRLWEKTPEAKRRWREYIKNQTSGKPLDKLLV